MTYGNLTAMITKTTMMMTVSFIRYFSVDHLSAIKRVRVVKMLKVHNSSSNIVIIASLKYKIFFFFLYTFLTLYFVNCGRLLHKTFTFNPFGNGLSSSSSLLPKKNIRDSAFSRAPYVCLL